MALLVRNALSVRTANGDKVGLAVGETSVAEQPRPGLSRLVACFATSAHFLFVIPFYGLVPVSVAAEQRVLLPAAAFLMSSGRGESGSRHHGNTSPCFHS